MTSDTKKALAQLRDPPESATLSSSPIDGAALFSLEEFSVMELEERHEMIGCCGANLAFCSTTNGNCDCPTINGACPGTGGNVGCVDVGCLPDTQCGTNNWCGDNEFCDGP